MRTLTMILTLALACALPLTAAAEMLVGDASNDQLCILNTATGELTEHAPVGTPHIVSLAYDAAAGILYCSDTSEGVNQILEIDPDTGATTLVCQVPDFWIVIHSLAVDPATGNLYAIDQEHTVLYIVNTATGELEPVGAIGVYWITGADFDPVTGDLYVCIGGLDTAGALYTVDKETAEPTFVADTHRLMGLGFDEDGSLYGVNNYWYPDDPGVYRIDKSSGAWEELATHSGRNIMSIDYVDLDVVRTETRSWSGVKRLFE